MKKSKETEQLSLQGTEEGEILARLAERVERAVTTIAELKKDRDRLQTQVDELTAELKSRSEEGDRLSTIEEEYSRFKEERELIKGRIESMLQNLESLDEVAAE